MNAPHQLLIIDLGSQYSSVIERSVRECGVRAALLSPEKAHQWLQHHTPQGIILSGGSASVYEKGAPLPPKIILKSGIPILGICYGLQWLTTAYGGRVVAHHGKKEYGKAEITILRRDQLFTGIPLRNIVWMSHGDSIGKTPKGFRILAYSTNKTIAAVSNPQKKLWGVQFHPEVLHTRNGKAILKNFLFTICKCSKNWKPKHLIAEIQNELKNTIGKERCVLGFSGGVDSTTLAAMLSPVLEKNLSSLCMNTGALRHDELREIRNNAHSANVRLSIVNASNDFFRALQNTTDAETKRKYFSKVYVQTLEKAAQKSKARFILQGSIATDFVESGAKGESSLIKSHHNIGNRWKLTDLHPFRNLLGKVQFLNLMIIDY